MKPWIRRSLLVAAVVAAAMQLVPYGRDHTNPPVVREPAWDAPRTRELAVRACFDCHSNESRWPWYSHVAPVSWLVQSDVDDGRRHLNFSEFDRRQRDAHEAAEEVAEGAMPPAAYAFGHADARLTEAERAELVAGLAATLGGDARGRDEDEDEDDGRRRRR